MNMNKFSTNLWSNKEVSAITTISNFIPSPLHHHGSLTLPTQQTMNEKLEENWSNQQPLWQQHHENAQNSSNRSSPDEITLEDLLVSWGVVKKGHSSCSISCQSSAPNMHNISSFPIHQMGELLVENQGDQQSLWRQHRENAHNSSYRSSSEEITFEDFLMKFGIILEGKSSCKTSFHPSTPTIYDTSSLQMGLEGTVFGQVETVAYGDHWGPGSVMSGVGPGGIFYEKGWMGMMKIEGHEQRVGDVDHQNLENITTKACPTKMCYNTGGMMGITGIGAQQTKMENGGHLESAIRGISLEEMCFSGVGSIGTKRIEEQQLGMGSSVTPISIDSLIIEPKTYDDKGMERDRSGKRKRMVYKTKKNEMEKKMKDKIKNRESASRSRARKEV
ncbi:uncharacterized protein LOC120104332 [Phoenix dactylifera]|uniref:Uncharacterized protein LOC120104332 n=1 Tax=Phoenix dactylifera TaxID=42345 RepID=A0A8B8ZD01_PHODC|nr:uncharacterized protein LOC120104332 [Phoenix dactylifera]